LSPQFTIQFPSPKQKLYRWMGRFIVLGSSALFVGIAESAALKIGWPILSLLLLAVDLVAERRNKSSDALLAGMTLQTLAWIFTGPWFMGILLLVLAVLHQIASLKKTLKVSKAGIWTSFPWPSRQDWNQVEFVILKDGMLTIEYRNGRVLQQPIEKDSTFREADFNEFCQQQCKP